MTLSSWGAAPAAGARQWRRVRLAEITVPRSAACSSIGMIDSGHRLSADAGAQVLAEGGNAIDAAAAAVFASWVVEPEMCRVGGTVQGVLHLADPDMFPSPIDGKWSKAYAAEIADRIDMRRACGTVRPVDPWPHETRITGKQRPAGRREPSRGIDNPGTTQVVAADKDGNVASFNITHGGALGSGGTTPGTDIVLNNATISFDPEPRNANSIRTNRRGDGVRAECHRPPERSAADGPRRLRRSHDNQLPGPRDLRCCRFRNEGAAGY